MRAEARGRVTKPGKVAAPLGDPAGTEAPTVAAGVVLRSLGAVGAHEVDAGGPETCPSACQQVLSRSRERSIRISP
jgi:hypothetical protein